MPLKIPPKGGMTSFFINLKHQVRQAVAITLKKGRFDYILSAKGNVRVSTLW